MALWTRHVWDQSTPTILTLIVYLSQLDQITFTANIASKTWICACGWLEDLTTLIPCACAEAWEKLGCRFFPIGECLQRGHQQKKKIRKRTVQCVGLVCAVIASLSSEDSTCDE